MHEGHNSDCCCDNNTSTTIKKRCNTRKQSKIYKSPPDLYGKVVGPTIDDTILSLWQTMAELCNCQNPSESDEEECSEIQENFGTTQTSKANMTNKEMQTYPDINSTMNQTSRVLETNCEHEFGSIPNRCSSSNVDYIYIDKVCECTGKNFKIGDGECKPSVRYALARITKYDDFTTYEIMKSTRRTPKNIPQYIEGIFVLRKRK